MNEFTPDFNHFRDSCVFAYRREKHGIFIVKMNEFTYVFTYFELALVELILLPILSISIYSYHSIIYLILFLFLFTLFLICIYFYF